MTRTPFIKLPPIYYNQNWHFDDTHKKMLQPNHLLHDYHYHQQHYQLPLILADQQQNPNNINNSNSKSDAVVVGEEGARGEEEDEFDDDDQVSKNSVDAGSPISSYSSSSSVSSFSSVNSVLFNSTTVKAAAASANRKGSLASILNSDPELLALEREERLGGYQTYFNANNNDVNVNVNDNNNNNKNNKNNKNNNSNNKNILVNSTKNTNSVNTVTGNNSSYNDTNNTSTTKKRSAPDPYSLDRKRQRRSQDRQIKGLRLFSKQVCNKVAEKGITTYNEVADELAADIQRNSASYDQKNIRRRVYDALNVLMALDIITKDRKEIKWLGINNCQTAADNHHTSNNNNDISSNNNNNNGRSNTKELLQEQILQEESRQIFLSQSIADSKSKLDDTLKQYLCLEKVVQRNAMMTTTTKKVISFPFFVVSSDTTTTKLDHNKSTITRISPHESCLSFTENASMMIYRDLEILSHIWRT